MNDIERLGREWAQAHHQRGDTPLPYGNVEHDAACANEWARLTGTQLPWDKSEENKVVAREARLKASAPDLLDALEYVRDSYQRMFDVMPVAWQSVDDAVTRAIAKAKGEA